MRPFRTAGFICLVLVIGFLCFACDDDSDSGTNPELRDSVFTSEMVDSTYYSNNAPFSIAFDIVTSTYVFLSIQNCYNDTVMIVHDDDLPAGYHNVEWSPDASMLDGIYAYVIHIYENGQSAYSDTMVIRLGTRTITSEIQAFADQHFNYDLYCQYEYNAAVYSDEACEVFTGSPDEWYLITWEDKKPYLPPFFTHEIDPDDTFRYYSCLETYFQQSGGAWDDATDFEVSPDHFTAWEGESDHLEEYKLLFTD